MTIQQMMLGGSAPLEASITGFIDIVQDLNNPNPPASQTVTSTGSVNVLGGVGSITYQWSITSGPASFVGGTTGPSAQITANVQNQHTDTGNIRCVVADGVTSITLNSEYRLGLYLGPPQ